MVQAIFTIDLPTNEAISMLLDIKVIKRSHKIKGPTAIQTELSAKGCIPDVKIIAANGV